MQIESRSNLWHQFLFPAEPVAAARVLNGAIAVYIIAHLVVDGLVSSRPSLVVSNIAQLMTVAFRAASLRPGLFSAKDTVKDPVDVELPVTLNHCHKTQCTPYSMSTVGCGWHVIRGPADVPPL